MICCSFVFEPGDYDDEFHKLDDAIAEYARSLPGFVRVDSWRNAEGTKRNSMYFFEDYSAVKQLAQFPDHIVAKGQVDRWYLDYRVDVFELKTSYGKS